MSPLKIKKLSKIRSELDKLDNLLIKLIKKRTLLVKGAFTKKKKSQIVDKKRIKEILLNIAAPRKIILIQKLQIRFGRT